MALDDIASFIATAAASGVIGNRMDALVSAFPAVQRLHDWLRNRLIEPTAVEPSPRTDAWVHSLSATDQSELRSLLREAIDAAGNSSAISASGVAIGNSVYGGTVIGSQYYYGTADKVDAWEYVKVDYSQEGDFDHPGRMKWAAYISRPNSDRLDVRDHVQIEQLLNELGQEGWELVGQRPNNGINGTDYFLRRPRRA